MGENGSAAGRWRVLVIDDERAIGQMLRAVLGHHDVEVLSSGESGLELLRADDAFDVIVCDLMMPTMTGIDVFTAIAAERPGVEQRFVFITGGAFTEGAQSFLARIPNRRLDKPFTTRALEAAMAETVAETKASRV